MRTWPALVLYFLQLRVAHEDGRELCAGIINGKDGGLQPTGNATRAEFATILMRYAKL